MQHSLQSIVEQGILPLTSACNTACLFCSHRFNPPGLRLRRQAPLTLAELESALPIIRRLPSLTIGESITTTIEGEPLTHPELIAVLRRVRTVAPQLRLQLTTNGILLSEERLQQLQRLSPLELTISVNSVDPAARRRLMGDQAGEIRPLLRQLQQQPDLRWHASLVAMPQIVGVADVLQTVQAAADHQASTIRVFWPGFTELTPVELRLPNHLQQELASELAAWARTHTTPLVVEPVALSDLRAEICGVMAGTVAARAGLAAGDVILAVDGQPVLSRTDAFQQAFTAADPELLVQRESELQLVRLVKPADSLTGLVMYGDLPPGVITRLRRHCRRPGRGLVLTSSLAVGQLRAALAAPRYRQVNVLAVPNRRFGGSIACAGLLTVEDFQAALAEQTERPDWLILPAAPFDRDGCDLFGVDHRQLAAFCQRLSMI